jgi:hypothetical protein
MLWSLRAEVESELRHLAKAQEKLRDVARAGDVRDVLAELEAVGDCERTIKALHDVSLQEVRAIADKQQESSHCDTEAGFQRESTRRD